MKLTKRFETDAHDEGVWAVSWLPHQNRLLTGSVDESVKCWEVGDEKLSLAYKRDYNYNLGVVSLDVHHNGQFAAATSLDSIITVWQTSEMQGALACIEAAPTESWTVTFGPQSEDELYLALAGGTRNSVVLWKIRQEGPENYMELHAPTEAADSKAIKREMFVLCAAYSPDGTKVAASCMDGTVALWDHATGKLLGKCEGHHRPVRCLRFTPDSRLLLTACDDMHLHMYDVESCQLIEAFSGHESWALSVAIHPGGSAFVSGGSDGKVKLWDMATRSCVQTLSGDHTDQVWGVSFSSDGTQLASVADDRKLVTYAVA